MTKQPVPGKRYYFPLNNYDSRTKSGLFTGKYYTNGNAQLITKNGEEWSIPVKDLKTKKGEI